MLKLLILAGLFATIPLGASLASVSAVSETVHPFDLATACKIVRSIEPRGDLTYMVILATGPRTITRPIYSDICDSPTSQYINKVYFRLDASPASPVFGIAADDLFITFSRFTVRER